MSLQETFSLVVGLLSLVCLLRTRSYLFALFLLLGNYLLLGLAIGTPSPTQSLIYSSAIVLTGLCLLSRAAGWLVEKMVDVPVVPDNSWFGYTGLLQGRHCCERLLHWTNHLGPVFQLVSFGRSVVVVSDPGLAKIAMRDLLSKGDLNQLRGAWRGPNTLTLDTGVPWTQRRSRLHPAFAAGALVGVEAQRLLLAEARHRCDGLLALADTGHTVRIDDHFGKLALSVLSRVVFGVELSGLLTVPETGLLYEDLRLYAEVRRTSYSLMPSHLSILGTPAAGSERRALTAQPPLAADSAEPTTSFDRGQAKGLL